MPVQFIQHIFVLCHGTCFVTDLYFSMLWFSHILICCSYMSPPTHTQFVYSFTYSLRISRCSCLPYKYFHPSFLRSCRHSCDWCNWWQTSTLVGRVHGFGCVKGHDSVISAFKHTLNPENVLQRSHRAVLHIAIDDTLNHYF